MKRNDIRKRKRNLNEYVDAESRGEELIEQRSEARGSLDNEKSELEEAQAEYAGFRGTPQTPNGYRGLYRRLLSLTTIIGLTDLAAQYALNSGAFPNFSPLAVLLLSGGIASVIGGFTNGLFVVKILDPHRPFRAVRIAKITAVTSGTMAAVAGLAVLGARFLPAAEFERLSAVVFGSLVVASESLPVTAAAIFFTASILNRPRHLEKYIARLKQDVARTEEFLEWLAKQPPTPAAPWPPKVESSAGVNPAGRVEVRS